MRKHFAECLSPFIVAVLTKNGFFHALRSVRIKTDFHASVLLFSLFCLRLFPSYHIAYIRNPSTPARNRIIANRITVIIFTLHCDFYIFAEPV